MNGGYLIFGDSRELNITIWSPYSLHLDNDGILLDTIQYELPNNYNTACTNGIETEYGYVLSGLIGTDVTAQCYVIQITPNGELIDTVWVGKQYSQSYTIARTPDNGYLLGGYSRDPSGFSPHPYLVRLNANMEVLWDTTYIISNLGWGLGNFNKLIADTTDNTYYALATVSSEPYDLVWLHLDDAGQILGHRVFPSTPYDVINDIPSISIWGRDMIRCNDGDFLIGLSRIQLDDPIGAYLVKMSPDGDTLRWIKEINPMGFMHKIHQLADSSFIVSSDVYAFPPNDLSLQGAVIHVSKEGGVLWKRIYGGDENDYIYDFIPTSDGGYFFTGRTESNLPNGGANVYLLKINCMGLLTEPQAAFSATIDTPSLTAAFHNLSQFVYPDSIDGGHFVWDFGDGTFSSDINPIHTYAQSGSYEVTLTAVVCSDTSVVEQNINAYVVGVNQVGANFACSPFIPNPTTGMAQLSYQLPSKQTAVLMLFDVNGKLLVSDSFSGTGTYTLNKPDLANGVYFYTVTSHGDMLLRNKLVIIK